MKKIRKTRIKEVRPREFHGKTRTKEYRAWRHAKERCYDPSDPRYPHYGGRGIKMSDDWKDSFLNFLRDIGEAPTKNHTLERVDFNKDYCADNCIWDTYKNQANNKTVNVWVEYKGNKMSLKLAAEAAGVNYKYLHHLFRKKGIPLMEAILRICKNRHPNPSGSTSDPA